MCGTFGCASLRGLRALFHRAAVSIIGQSNGDGGLRPPVRGRVLPSEYPHSARHGRATGVATGRAKIAGETHPSVIGASQATARSPPYPDPKHITLYSQPVEGAVPTGGGRTPRKNGPTAQILPRYEIFEADVGAPGPAVGTHICCLLGRFF